MAGTAFGSGGHNRLPDAVKRLRGTDQRCRTNPDAPQTAPVAIPAPPAHMGAAERRIWERLAPQVTALRTATEADLLAFEMMVGDVAFAAKVQRGRGASVNQKIAARRQAWVALAQFGLTPSSRSKVSQLAGPADEDDDLSEFVQ